MENIAQKTYQRSFNRFELKYIIPIDDVNRLLAFAEDYVDVDGNGDQEGNYRISSLYYDSPDFTAFWEKLDGVKFRRKVRLRQYGSSMGDQVFLEIKQRIDRTVQKRRTIIDSAGVMSALAGRREDNAQYLGDAVFDEAYCLIARDYMKPKVITSYDRRAFVGKFDPGLRITIDKNMRWRPFRGVFECAPTRDPFILPPTQYVLEVKCNNMIPLWLCACLNRLNLTLNRFSKYCGAIDKHVYENQLL